MKKTVIAALVAAILPLSALPAAAQPDNHWHGGSDNPRWDAADNYRDDPDHHDRRMTRDDYIYRGHDGRTYCRRDDGTTGLVAGGVGGALIGGAIGGSALAAVLGGVGGAAIGSSIDRGEVHCR